MGTGFAIAGVLSIVNMVLVVTALASVNGLMVLNSGENKIEDTDIRFRDIEGIGGKYGMGLVQDVYGRGWDQGGSYYDYTTEQRNRHPSHMLSLLGCNIHKTRGKVAMSGGILSIISLVFSAFATLSGHFSDRRRNFVCIALQIGALLFLIMTVAAASAIYNEQFLCESLHARVRFRDYFELNFVIPVIGFCAAICLATVILLLCSDNTMTPNVTDDGSDIPFGDIGSESE